MLDQTFARKVRGFAPPPSIALRLKRLSNKVGRRTIIFVRDTKCSCIKAEHKLRKKGGEELVSGGAGESGEE